MYHQNNNNSSRRQQVTTTERAGRRRHKSLQGIAGASRSSAAAVASQTSGITRNCNMLPAEKTPSSTAESPLRILLNSRELAALKDEDENREKSHLNHKMQLEQRYNPNKSNPSHTSSLDLKKIRRRRHNKHFIANTLVQAFFAVLLSNTILNYLEEATHLNQIGHSALIYSKFPRILFTGK